MASKVNPQTWGYDIALQREKELAPAFAAAWEKRTAALKQTTLNTNELIDRVEELEARLDRLPFPTDGPVLFTAWGIELGDWTPRQLCELAAGAGFGSIAYQHPRVGAESVRDECEALGLRFGLWQQPPVTRDLSQAVSSTRATFAIPNIESDADRQNFNPITFRSWHPDLDCAVVFTGGGFTHSDGTPTPEHAAPYIDAGFHAQPECYINVDPNWTPVNMDYFARQCGWPGSVPVIGVYGEQRASDYGGLLHDFPFWGCYLAEGLQAEDWSTVKEWTQA